VGHIRFHVLVETLGGLADVAALARAAPRIAGLFYGAGDLAREARWQLVPSRIPELYAMSQLLLAARGAGLCAIDSPCFEIRHAFQIEAHTRFGAELGFDGKAVIHPAQIESANRLFAPSEEAIQEAERVLAAYAAAEAAGTGALALDGQFIDAVHVEIARATLERARLAGLV
jgi:citrate lyase beta subunit